MRTALLVLIVASGCVTTQPYVFRPTEAPNLTSENRAVARYVVPRALPRGEIFVTSDGVVDKNEAGQPLSLTLGSVNHLLWPLLKTDELLGFLRDHPSP